MIFCVSPSVLRRAFLFSWSLMKIFTSSFDISTNSAEAAAWFCSLFIFSSEFSTVFFSLTTQEENQHRICWIAREQAFPRQIHGRNRLWIPIGSDILGSDHFFGLPPFQGDHPTEFQHCWTNIVWHFQDFWDLFCLHEQCTCSRHRKV